MVITDNLIRYFPDPNNGLGDILCNLSVLLKSRSNFKIQIEMQNDFKTKYLWIQLKEIFRIPDSRIQVIDIDYDPGYSFISNVMNKFNINSLYLNLDTIKLFGTEFKTGNYEFKGAIGIVRHNGSFYDSKINFNKFPGCRYYSDQDWDQIISLIHQSNRDVIELNTGQNGIENKAFIVNNLVDAIVSCDNGVAHLAHVLKTPVIMLPWQTDVLIAQKFHLDLRTYFLSSVKEICSWPKTLLDQTIYNLQNELGNNSFLDPYYSRTDLIISDHEKEFIAKCID